MLLLLCVVATALASATPSVSNCQQFCDVRYDGEAPSDEWCYCYKGIVKQNKEALLITKEEAHERAKNKDKNKDKNKNKENNSNKSRQTPTTPNNIVGSVIFSAANSSCSISTDWGGFPQKLFSPFPGFFSIRDQVLCGDWFLVYDNNTLLGPTSNVSAAFGCTNQSACVSDPNSPCRSRGCYYLAPNVEHNIEVVVGFSPFPPGVIGADVAYYAAAPGADCSQSQLTGDNLSLNQCTPTPPNFGPSPCSPFSTMPAAVGCPTFFVE